MNKGIVKKKVPGQMTDSKKCPAARCKGHRSQRGNEKENGGRVPNTQRWPGNEEKVP
jgi:hypothetical protein